MDSVSTTNSYHLAKWLEDIANEAGGVPLGNFFLSPVHASTIFGQARSGRKASGGCHRGVLM